MSPGQSGIMVTSRGVACYAAMFVAAAVFVCTSGRFVDIGQVDQFY